MTALMALTLCGLVVGLGLALVVREFWPSHARAGDAIENLAPRNLIFRVGEEAAPTSWSERMGRWSSQHLSNLPGVTTPRADLDLLGITTTRFYTDKTLWALIGLIFPGLLGVFSVVLDLPLPWPVFPLEGIVLAILLWHVPNQRVRNRARAARRNFAFATISYLRLVAIQRLASTGIVASMERAASVSEAWMFLRIREELRLARYAGLTPWATLDDLSERLKMPELREVADITRLAGDGAGVTGGLMARAASLRDRMLTVEQVAAAKATTAMQIPTAALIGVLLILLIFPAAVSLAS